MECGCRSARCRIESVFGAGVIRGYRFQAVRLLAIQDEDLSNLATSSNLQTFCNTAQESFGGLDGFVSINASTLVSLEGELPRQGLPRACETSDR
jgi:hypothetical protein